MLLVSIVETVIGRRKQNNRESLDAASSGTTEFGRQQADGTQLIALFFPRFRHRPTLADRDQTM
jgi:hypothetical protein